VNEIPPKPRTICITAQPADVPALAETLRAAGYVVRVDPPSTTPSSSSMDIFDANELRHAGRLN
jgi:hypothetical protein